MSGSRKKLDNKTLVKSHNPRILNLKNVDNWYLVNAEPTALPRDAQTGKNVWFNGQSSTPLIRHTPHDDPAANEAIQSSIAATSKQLTDLINKETFNQFLNNSDDSYYDALCKAWDQSAAGYGGLILSGHRGNKAEYRYTFKTVCNIRDVIIDGKKRIAVESITYDINHVAGFVQETRTQIPGTLTSLFILDGDKLKFSHLIASNELVKRFCMEEQVSKIAVKEINLAKEKERHADLTNTDPDFASANSIAKQILERPKENNDLLLLSLKEINKEMADGKAEATGVSSSPKQNQPFYSNKTLSDFIAIYEGKPSPAPATKTAPQNNKSVFSRHPILTSAALGFGYFVGAIALTAGAIAIAVATGGVGLAVIAGVAATAYAALGIAGSVGAGVGAVTTSALAGAAVGAVVRDKSSTSLMAGAMGITPSPPNGPVTSVLPNTSNQAASVSSGSADGFGQMRVVKVSESSSTPTDKNIRAPGCWL